MICIARSESRSKRQRVDSPSLCPPPDVVSAEKNGRTTAPPDLSAEADLDTPAESAPSNFNESSPTEGVPEENNEEVQRDERSSSIGGPQQSAVAARSQQISLTDEQRIERTLLIIRQHETLMLHAANCKSSCPSANCATMKRLFAHVVECQTTAFGGCPICKGPGACIIFHIKRCKRDPCPVPTCQETRECLQLDLQQAST